MILSCEDIKADIRTKGDAPFPSTLKRHLSASTGKNETIFMVMNSHWITFKGGQCISDQQLDERLKYALDEILKVSPSELMEISSSEHIGMGILEVKMQLKFIRMLRGGEKEYQGCMEKDKKREDESGKVKAKEMFNGVIWLWEEHQPKNGSRVSLPHMLKRVTSRAYNNLAIIAVKEGDVDGAVKLGEKAVWSIRIIRMRRLI